MRFMTLLGVYTLLSGVLLNYYMSVVQFPPVSSHPYRYVVHLVTCSDTDIIGNFCLWYNSRHNQTVTAFDYVIEVELYLATTENMNTVQN